MKLFILAVLVAVAFGAPEPPTGEFDPNDLMSGKNPDPALLTKVTGIYSSAGPDAAARLLQQQGRAEDPSRSTISAAVAAAGNADFVIDQIQFAPLLDEFDFNNDNNGGGAGRGGGGGYPGPPPAARSYGPPASGGYPSRNRY